ncbi:hypothetical protein C8R47DRAFT_1163721 [Mycena vitilis]|nr:hypothetical protein C8R47DRAFT_1163721 [Mycena vitilis]
MQTQSTVNSTALDLYWDAILTDMSSTGVSIFFYAFYLNLFIWALHTLSSRKTAGKKTLLGFIWMMAVLGTTQMVLRLITTATGARSLPKISQTGQPGPDPNWPITWLTYPALHIAQDGIFGLNNLVADSLFMHRCYRIWGSQWKVLIVPGILMVSTFGAGIFAVVEANHLSYSGHPFQTLPYMMGTTTNLVLTILTAGRIWWIRRDTLRIGPTPNSWIQHRSSRVITMILESGALYCAAGILLISSYPLGLPFLVIQAASMHLVNIAPTIIIIRVGLGKHTQHANPPLCRSVQHLQGNPSW